MLFNTTVLVFSRNEGTSSLMDWKLTRLSKCHVDRRAKTRTRWRSVNIVSRNSLWAWRISPAPAQGLKRSLSRFLQREIRLTRSKSSLYQNDSSLAIARNLRQTVRILEIRLKWECGENESNRYGNRGTTTYSRISCRTSLGRLKIGEAIFDQRSGWGLDGAERNGNTYVKWRSDGGAVFFKYLIERVSQWGIAHHQGKKRNWCTILRVASAAWYSRYMTC